MNSRLAAPPTPEEQEAIRAELAAREADDEGQPSSDRSQDGAAFILDAPQGVPALWGHDSDEVLWAEGESLLINGPAGVGKTTLVQQLINARLGIAAEVLGYPVRPSEQPVLYVAADRPRQVARSWQRSVTEEHRGLLAERLIVWQGALPFNLVAEPEKLSVFAQQFGAGTVVLDSLKDVAAELSKDETGSAVNRALQATLGADIQVAVLHHQRKKQAGASKPKALDDVYGSTFITAGAGSVLLLWGSAGDLVVELTHLKQPAAEVGPLQVAHDPETGTSSVIETVDASQLLRIANNGAGLTAYSLASKLTGAADPDRNAVEKARRTLEGLVKRGEARREDPALGGMGGSSPTRYFAATK